MKKKYLLIVTISLIINLNELYGQTYWEGPKITITKADFADWTLEANQDRITDNVWLTRADSKGLFNIAPGKETEFNNDNYFSPIDTEWAVGTISGGVTLPYKPWWDAINYSPVESIGQNMVLHLITDNIYIDFKILSWTQGNSSGTALPGGGYSYERSTDQNLGINDFKRNKAIAIYPNPSSEFIRLKGISDTQKIKIYNVLGGKVSEESVNSNSKIEIKNLPKGIYFIHLENGTAIKFVKN